MKRLVIAFVCWWRGHRWQDWYPAIGDANNAMLWARSCTYCWRSERRGVSDSQG